MTPILPQLPEWSKMDDLGGLVPSEVRSQLTQYALSAIELNRPKVPEGLVDNLEHACAWLVSDKECKRLLERTIAFLKSLEAKP